MATIIFIHHLLLIDLARDAIPSVNIVDLQRYVDALYFTVATLTTTGFGDITMTTTGENPATILHSKHSISS